MERLPSKTALFLTRVLNFTSLCLITFAFTGMARVIWNGWFGNTVFDLSWLLFLVNFAFYLSKMWLNKKRMARWIALQREVRPEFHYPDIWQVKWQVRFNYFGFKPGDEWRPIQATVLSFLVFCLMILFDAWRYPEYAPNLKIVWPGMLAMSVLVGSMIDVFGNDPTKRRKPTPPPRYDGPDDFGPVGVGARVRPPAPTLRTGNAFPEDDQRYA